jgi:hypothetical protein
MSDNVYRPFKNRGGVICPRKEKLILNIICCCLKRNRIFCIERGIWAR